MSNLNRLKVFVIEGIKVGSIIAFWSACSYIFAFSVYMSTSGAWSSPGVLTTQGYPKVADNILGFLSFLLFVAPWMFAFGAIPATLVGIVGGGFIGTSLTLWKKAIPASLACLMGFIVGTSVVLLANFLHWLVVHPRATFMEYLLPDNILDLTGYVLYVNWFFLPNIIAIILSPYIGWRINKNVSSKLNI